MKLHITPIKNAALLSLSFVLLSKIAKAEGKAFTKFEVKSIIEPEEKKPVKKSSGKKTAFAPMNNSTVKIYPDIIKREMHVVAKENDGKEISFFVFDVQGTLMQQYKMKPKDHYRVAGLKKGVYIYRVFSGDQESATGKFEIR